ncbi:MAG: MFS transporter [Puniceicoccales bacterium]|jgi:LPLT family lysophospholipid transporter-like MFS transporter|nr:MFS transporter [Puniceicoccales bacterium]
MTTNTLPVPRRSYPLLLAGQFLSAFGDNAILVVILGPLTLSFNRGELAEEALRSANTLYTVLLFIPCVLFAPLAGFLNDRFAKSRCLVGGNAAKLAGALVCALSLVAGDGVLGAGYFIVGIGVCVYGPAKYGILPEVLPRERLVSANGTVEMLTLVAILAGAIGGGLLVDKCAGKPGIAYAIVVAVYAAALGSNALMARTPSDARARFSQNASAFALHARDLMRSPRVGRMLLGTALFWIVGAAMKAHFQPWGVGVLKLENNTEIGLLLLTLSLGVMGGSVLSGRLHKVGDLRRVPLYGFALAGIFVLAWSAGASALETFWLGTRITVCGQTVIVPVALLVALAGVFAGLFLIPINAALQAETDPAKMGKTIAVQNLFDNLGMCLALVYLYLGNLLGISLSGIFLGLAIGTTAVTAAMLLGRKARA